MDMKNDEMKYRGTLNHVLNIIYEDVEDNPSEIEQYLKDEGYDYEDLMTEGSGFVKGLVRRERIELARDRRKKLFEVLANFSKEVGHETKDMLFNKLKEIASGDKQLQLAFHKLESLSEGDLRNIVNDVEFLKMLDQKNEQSDVANDETDT